VAVTLPRYIDSITPPKPPMAAEVANRLSFVRTAETPDVWAAVSDVRTAVIARPDTDRCRLRTSSTTMPTMTSITIA
jgi:hypothetical protein